MRVFSGQKSGSCPWGAHKHTQCGSGARGAEAEAKWEISNYLCVHQQKSKLPVSSVSCLMKLVPGAGQRWAGCLGTAAATLVPAGSPQTRKALLN